MASLYTGLHYKAVPRFGEFCSCCCLPLLPQLACSILATWEWPYGAALYMWEKEAKARSKRHRSGRRTRTPMGSKEDSPWDRTRKLHFFLTLLFLIQYQSNPIKTRGKFSRWPAASEHFIFQCQFFLIPLFHTVMKCFPSKHICFEQFQF